MKRMKIVTAFLLLAAVLFSGCSGVSEDLQLAVCGSYAVPGMFCHNLKGGSFSCNVLERDEYGRILYLYETMNFMTASPEKAYVICQKIDSDYAYYLEDICYLSADDESNTLEALKKANHWGMTPDESSMSKREITVSFDLYIMTESAVESSVVRTKCANQLDITEQQITSIIMLDMNASGQELLWLTAQKNGRTEHHYVLVNTDGTILCSQVVGVQRGELILFKQENGWIYGG